jgi:hypothetical protein
VNAPNEAQSQQSDTKVGKMQSSDRFFKSKILHRFLLLFALNFSSKIMSNFEI